MFQALSAWPVQAERGGNHLVEGVLEGVQLWEAGAQLFWEGPCHGNLRVHHGSVWTLGRDTA